MLDSWKHKLAEYAKEKELRHTGGTPEPASFHSHAYHRYFEGYTEVKRVNEHGHQFIERTYTGKYYEPKLEPFRRLTLRLFYILFFIGGTVLFAFSATRTTPCNSALYVNLFQALSVPMLLWCAYVLVLYIPATGKLTIGEYRGQHKPLIQSSLIAAVSMWLTGLGALVCFFIHLNARDFTDLLCAAGFAVSGGLMFLIFIFERNLEYDVTNSDAQVPIDGVEIQ